MRTSTKPFPNWRWKARGCFAKSSSARNLPVLNVSRDTLRARESDHQVRLLWRVAALENARPAASCGTGKLGKGIPCLGAGRRAFHKTDTTFVVGLRYPSEYDRAIETEQAGRATQSSGTPVSTTIGSPGRTKRQSIVSSRHERSSSLERWS